MQSRRNSPAFSFTMSSCVSSGGMLSLSETRFTQLEVKNVHFAGNQFWQKQVAGLE